MLDRKNKFILTIISAILIFLIIQFYLYRHRGTEVRTETSLLNQYYALMKTDPDSAKRALELILEKNPKNIIALKELGYWYLKNGDVRNALKQFESVHTYYPDDLTTIKQLSYIYDSLGLKASAAKLSSLYEAKNYLTLPKIQRYAQSYFRESTALTHLLQQSIQDATFTFNIMPDTFTAQVDALQVNLSPTLMLAVIQQQPQGTPASILGSMSERDRLLNEYYKIKKINEIAACYLITRLADKYPNDVLILKEAGYLALKNKNNLYAYYYFCRAYALTKDPTLALQNGYILDGLRRKSEAYYYFDLATKSKNIDERMKAEIAKTNLRGSQSLFLPEPFYIEIFYDPFYFSRFKLLVSQVIAHAGVVLWDKYHLNAYYSYRRTEDNKSGNAGVISNIFEDNAQISSIGLSGTPFPSQPFLLFAEWGKAVDLVYRNRSRWRNDFRGGAVYYNEWGYGAEYTLKPVMHLKFKADLYADAIYYSRYTDWIGTARFRPGIELVRYGSTSVFFYYKIFLIQDTNRDFYNNLVEYGPGIAFTPSDRYNLTIRYECLNGHYLPAGGRYKNPYSINYHNNVSQLNIYIRF